MHLNRLITQFDFQTAKQCDEVIVLGGGSSINSHLNQISNLKNATILCANYKFKNISAKYTYFTDKDKFIEQFHSVDSDIIINCLLCKIAEKYALKKKIFQIGTENGPVAYDTQISLSEKGTFNHKSMGSAGFGAIACASLMKPKKLYLAGFDGPSEDLKYKYTFDNRKIIYKRPVKQTMKRLKYFLTILLPWLISRGICIYSLENDRLWGANKKELGIQRWEL